jgi:hypothetical protein
MVAGNAEKLGCAGFSSYTQGDCLDRKHITQEMREKFDMCVMERLNPVLYVDSTVLYELWQSQHRRIGPSAGIT